MSAPPRLPDGERLYAIGDVHGRLDLLAALIARIRADNDARPPAAVRIVLLGDIIDRGPASAEIVARCRAIAARDPRFVVLKGNHEAMMIHALEGSFPALGLWLRHGGDAALRSWGVAEERIEARPSPALLAVAREAIPADVTEWLDGRPLWLEAGDYLFVHAGIRPGITLHKQVAEDLLWIRAEFLDAADDHGRVIVHGHSITAEGMVERPNRIGIDTGAYRTHILTALALEGEARWSLTTDAGSSGHAAGPNALEEDIAAILGPPAGRNAAPARWRGLALGGAALGAIAAALVWIGGAPRGDAPPHSPAPTPVERRPAPVAVGPLPPPAAPPVPKATPTSEPARPAILASARRATPRKYPPAHHEAAPAGQPPAEPAAPALSPSVSADPAPSAPPAIIAARAEPPEARPSPPPAAVADAPDDRRAARRRTLESLDAIRLLRRQ